MLILGFSDNGQRRAWEPSAVWTASSCLHRKRFLSWWAHGGSNSSRILLHTREVPRVLVETPPYGGFFPLFSPDSQPCCWCHVEKMFFDGREEVTGLLLRSLSVPMSSSPPASPSCQGLLGRAPWSPLSPRVLGPWLFQPCSRVWAGWGGLLTCSMSGKGGWMPFRAGPQSAMEETLRRSHTRNHLPVRRSIGYSHRCSRAA